MEETDQKAAENYVAETPGASYAYHVCTEKGIEQIIVPRWCVDPTRYKDFIAGVEFERNKWLSLKYDNAMDWALNQPRGIQKITLADAKDKIISACNKLADDMATERFK